MHHIFVDSDVIISAAMSHTGAAHLLLNNKNSNFQLHISDISYCEVKAVATRLGMKIIFIEKIINKNFYIIKLKDNSLQKLKSYEKYVYDINDAHIIMGADLCKADFLITYNIKDYRVNAIKSDLNIIVYKPAQLLQYFRSINVSI